MLDQTILPGGRQHWRYISMRLPPPRWRLAPRSSSVATRALVQGVNETLRAAAQRRQLSFADVRSRLPSERSQLQHYLVADGHCNDRGYHLMAIAFAAAIEPPAMPK